MSFFPILVLLIPLVFGVLFLLIRLGFLWLEREQIALHVRHIYARSLIYARKNNEMNYRLLVMRQALLGTFFSDKKVEMELLISLQSELPTEDKSLQDSFEFLTHAK